VYKLYKDGVKVCGMRHTVGGTTPYASRLKPYTYSAEGIKESCAAPSDALKAQYMLALGRRPQKQDLRRVAACHHVKQHIVGFEILINK